jgi:hypothetical protein
MERPRSDAFVSSSVLNRSERSGLKLRGDSVATASVTSHGTRMVVVECIHGGTLSVFLGTVVALLPSIYTRKKSCVLPFGIYLTLQVL